MASHSRKPSHLNGSGLHPQARHGHGRKPSQQPKEALSSHTSDAFLNDFRNPSFDPAAYLNAALPPLRPKTASSHVATDALPLSELSNQTQTLLSQLNTYTNRLSTTLTQLTDDILRSSSRLAYEVELLRGETVSLQETMHDTLAKDIEKFLPGGLRDETALDDASGANLNATNKANQETPDKQSDPAEGNDPEFVKKLQTMTIVRERLDSVVKTFGDAMEFVFPPSELSVSSSFLSVSAPEPGSQQQSSEQKGQLVLKGLREEIAGLMKNTKDPVEGIANAAQRIEELKLLTRVWKGTAEEKGRNKFIESLAKMVEDRHRELMREMEQAAKKDEAGAGLRALKGNASRDASANGPATGSDEGKHVPGGFGLMSQLQKLRSGL